MGLAFCTLLQTTVARGVEKIDAPGTFLDETESLRVKDHRLFAERLAQIHREAPRLSSAEKWHLQYLDAFESSLEGNFSAAEEPLRAVIAHSGNPALAAKASSVLLTNLAASHRYEEAFKLAHQMTLALPGIQEKAARFQILGTLSQMLNLAGQTDLAIKYAQLMDDTVPDGTSLCDPQFKIVAALSNARQLSSSSKDLQQAIDTCQAAGEPIVMAAAQLIQSSLYLDENRPDKALALLERIAPSIRNNDYYPHTLSAWAQRARAYEQLGRDEDAQKAAMAAVSMTKPGEISGYLRTAYQVLYRISKKRGNLAAALNYYERYVTQDKGYLNDLSMPALAYQTVQQQVLTRKLETAALSKQNSILKLQQALDAKAVEAGRLYIVLLSILLASIVLWLLRLKRSQLRFKKLASHDGLTGILNHQHFISECERLLRLLEKRGGPAGLVSIDLDHFKLINDTYGHAMGDTVLRHAVAVCMEHLRPGDLFGRLGGEEFGVLLVDCGRDQSLAIADRIRMAILAEPLNLDGKTIAISASVGVAFTGSAGYNLQLLCRDADAALYRAKRSGRNRVASDIQDGDLVSA